VLVLSKPLGTGIVLAGGSDDEKAGAIARMRTLNRAAAEALAVLPSGEAPHAVTDVTGFGLLGHGWEMAERSNAVLRFASADLPLYPGAMEAAEAGTRTGGDTRNRASLESHARSTASAALEAIAFDPQTSGGLLASVSRADGAWLTEQVGFTVVGEVAAGGPFVELS
jgi:selenide,water dikinase